MDGIRKQRANDKRNATVKNAFKWAWQIFYGLAHIYVVLGIYSALQRPFEIIVASLLITLYATVLVINSFSAVRYLANIVKADAMFSDIRSVLGKPVTPEQQDKADKLCKHLEKNQGRILTYQFTLGIVSFIALWHLIRAIGWF